MRLDVLVELKNGTLIDVEMECDARRAGGERWLYHWARLFVSTLRRGESYEEVDPVACIVFLDARTPTRSRFHSIYEAREVHDHSRLSPTLAIHVIELPRIAQAREEHSNPELQRWARFLRVEDEAALESLAEESPIMAEAKHALETLSREPSAQKIAELRRDAEIFRRLERAQDLREGRAEGLAVAILSVCEVLGLEVSEARQRELSEWSEEQRHAALGWLKTHRSWPDRP